jgi:hypothetical protein
MAGKKISFKDINEQHAAEIDINDPKQRTRYRRMLDRIYERGLSDELTAQKAAEEYCARVAGKPITPVDVTGTVTHQTTEQHVESILENLAMLKAKPKPEPGSERVN